MDKACLVAVAAALMGAPLAFAHVDGGVAGTPKTYCEDVTADTSVHEYGPPVTGSVLAWPLDGSVPPCPHDPQWDGHYEWAIGGAWLLACETACGPSGTGDGALLCWETYADHPESPTVAVLDTVLSLIGISMEFVVAADYYNNLPVIDPTAPECGDFESDHFGRCVDDCVVTWPAGLDGSYQVYVCPLAVQGHVYQDGSISPKEKRATCSFPGCLSLGARTMAGQFDLLLLPSCN